MKRTIYVFLALIATLTTVLPSKAREVISLNEGWRFFFRYENSSDDACYVTLPHTWNVNPRDESGLSEQTGNYINALYIPDTWSSKRIFLKCYGVQSSADLFVNGCFIGNHRGAATAFAFEITDRVRFGEENKILFMVSNAARPDLLPTSSDMNFYGGIYRNVELIVTEKTAVSPLYLGSTGVLVHPEKVSAEKCEGEVELHLLSNLSSCAVNLAILDREGQCVYAHHHKVKVDDKPLMIPFRVEEPALWSPEERSLYTVSVALHDNDSEQLLDSVAVRTGFRALELSASGGFRINDQRIDMKGVSLFHDNVVSGGIMTPEDMECDLEVIRDLGANAIRSAVMPHPQPFYDRCDEEGLLVWVDVPLHRTFLSDMSYIPTPRFEENGLEQLREIVAQNINHPSVVMWGIFSRLWQRGDDPLAYVRRLNQEAHTLDASRPTVAASDQDGDLNFVTDGVVWLPNMGWERGQTQDVKVWSRNMRKNWAHLASGVAYGAPGMPGHRINAGAGLVQTKWFPEERQTRFHEDYASILHGDSLFWGMWINNLFDYGSARRPYGINCEGMVSIDRRDKKDIYYLYRALWNRREPTLHLTEKRHVLRDSEPQVFHIYSSEGMPSLVVGADSVAVKEYGPCQYYTDPVPLKMETVEVKVAAGALRDSVTLRVGMLPKSK